MRSLMVTLVLAALLVLEGRAAAQDGAKALDDAWIKAAKAGDVEGLVSLYAPDGVLYPPDAMEARGTAAIRKTLADLLGAFTVKDMTIAATYHTAGDLSVSYGRFTMAVVPKSGGGAPATWEGRGTVIARKTGAKWLIVADHASMPAPPAPPPPR